MGHQDSINSCEQVTVKAAAVVAVAMANFSYLPKPQVISRMNLHPQYLSSVLRRSLAGES